MSLYKLCCFLECFPATLIIPNRADNFSYPNKLNYIKNITIATTVIYNCSVLHTNISTWTLERIDPLTDETLAYINISRFRGSNTSRLFMPNGTLSYGLYKFTFNFTIITNDETVGPYISTIFDYIRIMPTGFVVSGFNINYGELPQTELVVGPTDTLAFIPAFYSYDSDSLTNPKVLNYEFYCILADLNPAPSASNVSLNFTNDIYWINPNAPLTKEQLDAEDTCFKDES